MGGAEREIWSGFFIKRSKEGGRSGIRVKMVFQPTMDEIDGGNDEGGGSGEGTRLRGGAMRCGDYKKGPELMEKNGEAERGEVAFSYVEEGGWWTEMRGTWEARSGRSGLDLLSKEEKETKGDQA
ncbi:hypothetical protein HAX54_016932 [Datura stramonium]|uniref:Uncharacterized protein n=1 Tax=Datura stramonium TaxID=4076 RepID=A0ABS8S036_DATST|nr:hypothetical protein [Datura stramonium]